MDYDTWKTQGYAHRCGHCGQTYYDSDGGCSACVELDEYVADKVEAYASKPNANGHYPSDEDCAEFEAQLRDNARGGDAGW